MSAPGWDPGVPEGFRNRTLRDVAARLKWQLARDEESPQPMRQTERDGFHVALASVEDMGAGL